MLAAAPGLDTDSRLSFAKPTDRFTKALEETAAQNDVEVRQSFETRDRHVASVILALHADLEDDGESPITALAVYLQKRYGVFRPRTTQFRGGMPATRLKRVLKFIGEKSR
jgi:AraC family transcriptional regulator